MNSYGEIISIPPTPPDLRGLRLFLQIKRDLQGFFERLMARDGPIAVIQPTDTTNLILKRPESVDYVLRSHDYDKPPLADFLNPLLGDGQLLSNGPLWNAQKRQAQPAFSRPNHSEMVADMAAAAQETLDRWQTHAQQNTPVNLALELPRLTFSVLMRALFHEPHYDQTGSMQEALGVILERTGRRIFAPFKLPARFLYNFPPYRQARITLQQAASNLITKRQADLQNPGYPHASDLLSILSAPPPKGSLFSALERQQQVLTYLLAGHETTANGLTFCFKLLSEHPDAWQKVKEEADRVVDGPSPTLQQINAMPYIGAVFKEALRLYPPIVAVSRQAQRNDTIPLGNGQRLAIPARQLVTIPIWDIHKSGDSWTNPKQFDPERFTAQGNKIIPGAYVPFALGPRNCIGMSFALQEASVVLAMIARRFDVKIRNPENIQAHPAITLRPNGPVWADITMRPHAT